jgi:hypothetical protein
MAQPDAEKRLRAAIIEYVRAAATLAGADVESLGIAADCLTTAFALSASELEALALKPRSLLDVFTAGAGGSAGATGSSADGSGRRSKRDYGGVDGACALTLALAVVEQEKAIRARPASCAARVAHYCHVYGACEGVDPGGALGGRSSSVLLRFFFSSLPVFLALPPPRVVSGS